MQLSEQQLQELKAGATIELTIRGVNYVVVRRELFDRARNLVDGSPRETYAAVLKVLDQSDDAPEQYLEYLDEPS